MGSENGRAPVPGRRAPNEAPGLYQQADDADDSEETEEKSEVTTFSAETAGFIG